MGLLKAALGSVGGVLADARISEMGIRYSALLGHTEEFSQALKDILSEKWRDRRGIEIGTVGVKSVRANEKDEQMIKEMQREATYMDPTRAASALPHAQAEAMKAAASNPNAGPAMAFMGMGMADQAGGMHAQSLYAMGQQPAPAASAGWTCACGQTGNTGKFCPECGAPSDDGDIRG